MNRPGGRVPINSSLEIHIVCSGWKCRPHNRSLAGAGGARARPSTPEGAPKPIGGRPRTARPSRRRLAPTWHFQSSWASLERLSESIHADGKATTSPPCWHSIALTCTYNTGTMPVGPCGNVRHQRSGWRGGTGNGPPAGYGSGRAPPRRSGPLSQYFQIMPGSPSPAIDRRADSM